MSRPEVDGPNAGFAQAILDEYLVNPDAVPAEWRALFESGDSELLTALPGLARLLEGRNGGNGAVAAPVAAAPEATPVAPAPEPPAVPAEPAPAPAVDEQLLGGVAAAMALVKAFRTHGHLAARLDPLGSEPPGDPALEPQRLVPPLTPELQARIPARLLRVACEGETLADVLPKLQEIYCGTIAYEVEHISDHEQRVWLRKAIESGRYRQPLSADDRVRLLGRLSEVEALETYLYKTFLGQKQFSIEGLDVLVPVLDEAIELASRDGAHEVVMGMAHRGRLNVIAHTLGRPYEVVLREFEGERTIDAVSSDPEGGTGDVKYHLGARATRRTSAGGDRASRSCRTRATSRLSTRSSRAGRARSRPIARAATGRTGPRCRSRSSSTATRRSPARASWPRRSTSRGSSATRPAGRSTSSPTTRSASPPTPWRAARPATPPTSRRATTCRSSTSTPTIPRRRSPPCGSRSGSGAASAPTS